MFYPLNDKSSSKYANFVPYKMNKKVQFYHVCGGALPYNLIKTTNINMKKNFTNNNISIANTLIKSNINRVQEYNIALR
jgi:hypothetical protein